MSAFPTLSKATRRAAVLASRPRAGAGKVGGVRTPGGRPVRRGAVQAAASDAYDAIQSLRRADGSLPPGITQKTADEMAKSMKRYFERCAGDKLKGITDEALRVAQNALKTVQAERPGVDETVTEAIEPDPDRIILRDYIEGMTGKNIEQTMDVKFFLKVPTEVATGARAFVEANASQDEVDAFPAWELKRYYDRKVPRGSPRDPEGPENGWDDDAGRWVKACEDAGDEDARKVYDETGRMVALKSSGVWQALGDGAGGYDDTLGAPFAPFAFNSGMEQEAIDRPEAEELGLLEEGEEAEPNPFDFANLFKVEARGRTTAVALTAAGNEDEPRDERGRWTAAGAFARKHGLVAIERVGQDDKGKGGAWQRVGGGEVPDHAKGVVPPGYHDAHINPDPKADVQGVGTDDKGRTKRFYSKAFEDRQAAEKFGRIEELRKQKAQVFADTERDMAHSDPKISEPAACMKLVQTTGLRPGSDTDTKAKVQAFGATTLEGRHVHIGEDGSVRLKFVGKEGKHLDIPVEDTKTAAMLKERKAAAGDAGKLFDTNDAALRDYAHERLDHGGFKPKDFRTLKGTEEAQRLVDGQPKPANEKEFKARVKDVATKVSEKLGNTWKMALEKYISPSVWSEWRTT